MTKLTTPPRIYADFNGLVEAREPGRIAVVLDTFGSARDLANAGVALEEGMPLITWDASDDDEDLEGHGTAHYDAARRRWVVELDVDGVRYVPKGERSSATTFRCIACRQSAASLDRPNAAIVSHVDEPCCPSCGASLLLTIAPPRRT